MSGGTVTANAASALGSGTVSVSGGVLNANAAQALPATAVTVSGGTLNANAAQSPTSVTLASGAINDNGAAGSLGTAALAQSGGVLTLGYWQSVSSITLSGGTIDAGSNATLGAAALTMDPTSGTARGGAHRRLAGDRLAGQQWRGASVVVLGNSAARTPATLIVGGNNASTTFGGTIGDLGAANSAAVGSLVKTGTGNLTLGSLNSFSGGLTINGGTVTATVNSTNQADSSLGLKSGRGTVSVNSGGTLYFGINNVFGGSGMNAANLPTIAINGGAVNSSRYNAVGNVVLSGGTLLSNVSDTGSYAGDQLLGSVTVNGTASSLMGGGTGYYLLGGTNTFNVGLTGAAGGDLVVSASLNNSGGDYGNGSTASLLKTGAGMMSLTAANAYTGATTVSQGTLSIAAGGAISSSSPVNVAAGAMLTSSVNNPFGNPPSGAWTISGTIQGQGSNSIAQTMPPAVTLDNGTMSGSAYAGWGTFLTNGNVTITASGANNTIGAGNLGIYGNNTLTLDPTSGTDSLAVSAELGASSANGGSLIKSGNGLVTLTAANTYTGGTTISGGTLVIGNGGSLSPNSPIVNNATLDFSHSDNIAQGTQFTGNPITGTGRLVQLGPGTVTLGGGNLYSGGTTIFGGVLQLGNSESLGTGSLAASGGTLDLNGTSAAVGDLTGAAGVITSLNNGPAALSVGTSNSTVFSGTIVDSGTNQVSLTKNGAGELTLLGNNTYSGTTTVNGGTLALGNGGTSGQFLGPVALNNNATLLVNRADFVDFTATISGAGSLMKMGAGALILEGADTYTGGTIVRDGTLLATDNEAIADGTSLIVGNPAAFPAIVALSPAAAAGHPLAGRGSSPTAAAVPEPGSAALAAAACAMIAGGCTWRRRKASSY